MELVPHFLIQIVAVWFARTKEDSIQRPASVSVPDHTQEHDVKEVRDDFLFLPTVLQEYLYTYTIPVPQKIK